MTTGPIARLLDAGIDPSRSDPSLLRRIRVISFSLVAMAIFSAGLAVEYLRLGILPLVAALVVAMAVSVGLIFLLRATRRTALCGYLAVSLFYVLVIASNVVSGGFFDANFAWLYAVPLAAALLLDLRACWVWVGVVSATMMGFWLLPGLGVEVPDLIPKESHAVHGLINRVALLLAIAILATIFDMTQRRSETYLRIRTDELAREITVRKEAEEAAQQASRAKSEFLAMMSHEIRTPMNGVLGMTGLILDTKLNTKQREYAEAVRTSASALLSIINEILDFSRIEAGRLELEEIDFDVEDAIEAVTDLMAPGAQKKGLEIIGSVARDVPRKLHGDVGRLRQVLTNLVGNAVKFTDAGEVLIRVELAKPEEIDPSVSASDDGHSALTASTAARSSGRLRVIDPNDPELQNVDIHAPVTTVTPVPDGPLAVDPSERVWIRLAVRDTGIGIDPDKTHRLFDPFRQADSSASRRHGGTGLGLTIAHQLTGLMGGKIGVKSRRGSGSVFWLDVPLALQNRRAIDPEPPDVADLFVLIVDDSEHSRRGLKRTFRKWGARVVEAENATVAMSRVREAAGSGRPVDFAVIDARLGADAPEGGFDLFDQLADEGLTPALRVILLTQLAGHGERQRQAEAAGAATVRKPVARATLHQATAAVLRGEVLATSQVGSASLLRPASDDEESIHDAPAGAIRILVVEDNTVNQRVAVGLLDKLCYRSDVAANGREAVQLHETIEYGAILMDCQMPDMDGYEATREIRRREDGSGHRTPIIAMTAGALQRDQERVFAAGMDDYLVKPVSEETLKAVLARWCGTLSPSEFVIGSPEDFARGKRRSTAAEVAAQLQDENAELFADVIKTFRAQTPERVEELRAAQGEGDVEVIRALAHRLKGSCLTVGAEAPAATCGELEAACTETAAAPPEAARLMARLVAQLAEFEQRLAEDEAAAKADQAPVRVGSDDSAGSS